MKNKPQILDSDNNYFASMTDLLVGVIFMFIILIMYLALQSNQLNMEKNQNNEMIKQLTESGKTFEQIFIDLNDELQVYKDKVKSIDQINNELKDEKERILIKLNKLKSEYDQLVSSDKDYYEIKKKYEYILNEFESIENLFQLKENLTIQETKIRELTSGLKEQTIEHKKIAFKVLSDYLYKIKNSLEEKDIYLNIIKKEDYFLIRFNYETQYESNHAWEDPDFRTQLVKFGDILFENIDCYINSNDKKDYYKCSDIKNYSYFPGLYLIQLVGHTDDKKNESGQLNCEGNTCEKNNFLKSNVVVNPGNEINSYNTNHANNSLLALRRANHLKNTVWRMFENKIKSLKNSKGFNIIDVKSSAADDLLIINSKSEFDHAKNRRIEIQFWPEEIKLEDILRLNESFM